MLAGGVAVFVIGRAVGEPVMQPPSAQVSLAVVALIAGAIIGYGSYQHLLGSGKVSLATSYAYMNPVVAILLGTVILGERVSPSEIIGIAIILAGVVCIWLNIAWARVRPAPQSQRR
jgi:drug/metabolite transporter (DMT)-like permease